MVTLSIRVPIDNDRNFLEYATDIVDVEIPVLFDLEKKKSLEWYVNEVRNQFCSYLKPDLKVKLKHQKGQLYLTWPSSKLLFTRHELLKIERKFSHPSTTKAMELLKREYSKHTDSKLGN